jgi:predicted Zn-ribbon and HTH transcriptional regulator
MGHYMDIAFEVQLNKMGIKIISSLYETKSWEKTITLFPKIPPNVFEGITNDCNVVPFSQHSSLKEIPSSQFNSHTGMWKVCCCFKWKYPVDKIMKNFLQHVIVTPSTIKVSHDLWDQIVIENLIPIYNKQDYNEQEMNTYYFCEPCGNEWGDKHDFVQKCPSCQSDNIYISALTDTAPENQEKEE